MSLFFLWQQFDAIGPRAVSVGSISLPRDSSGCGGRLMRWNEGRKAEADDLQVARSGEGLYKGLGQSG
jgi:hypothetical protein